MLQRAQRELSELLVCTVTVVLPQWLKICCVRVCVFVNVSFFTVCAAQTSPIDMVNIRLLYIPASRNAISCVMESGKDLDERQREA